MAGNWAYWLGCHGGFIAFSATDNAQAHTNYVTYHTGVGSGAYWFMGGPGVDPQYNGTTTEASAWGARQVARALSATASATSTRSTPSGRTKTSSRRGLRAAGRSAEPAGPGRALSPLDALHLGFA